MKNALKLTVASVLALGVTAAQADFMERTALTLGLQYGDSSTHWDQVTSLTVNNTVNNSYHQVDKDLGYLVGLSYRLMSQKNARVFVDYEHFDADDDNKAFDGGSPFASNWNAAMEGNDNLNASLDDEEALSRLGYNRIVNVAPSFDLMVDSFLAFGKVKREYRENYRDTSVDVPGTNTLVGNASLNTNEQFSGLGPGLGFTGKVYPMAGNRHVNVYLGAGATLLYGDAEHNASATAIDGNETTTVTRTTTSTKADRVVPKLDAKFGVEYAKYLSADVKMNMNLGLKWVHYSNVVGFESAVTGDIATSVTNLGVDTTSANHDWSRWAFGLAVTLGGAHS